MLLLRAVDDEGQVKTIKMSEDNQRNIMDRE